MPCGTEVMDKTWSGGMEVFRPKDFIGDEIFDVWVEEALFGCAEISSFTHTRSRGLEIGAGAGLLAAHMSKSFEEVVAIEPISGAFSKSETVLNKVKEASYKNLIINRTSLEKFQDGAGFDLIWSINVFEHLEDWKAGLLKTKSLLRPGGRAIILCPNYDIPYESHFGLPILASKKITRTVFAKRINKFEEKYSCIGLWKSLNFIRASRIIQFAQQHNFQIKIDKTVTLRMFQRVTTHRQFAQRHKHISPIISLAYKVGLAEMYSWLPARMQPYIALHILADETPKNSYNAP